MQDWTICEMSTRCYRNTLHGSSWSKVPGVNDFIEAYTKMQMRQKFCLSQNFCQIATQSHLAPPFQREIRDFF